MARALLSLFKIGVKRWKSLNPYRRYFLAVLSAGGIIFFLTMATDRERWRGTTTDPAGPRYSTTPDRLNRKTESTDDRAAGRREDTIGDADSRTVDTSTRIYLSGHPKEDGRNRTRTATLEDGRSSSRESRLVTGAGDNPGTEGEATFLTIDCNYGRLGNQMFTYAALIGLSSLNNRVPYAPRFNSNKLRPYFHVTAREMVRLPRKSRREYRLASYFRPADARIPDDANVLCGYPYPNSFTFFDHVRDRIRNEFRFRERIVSRARAFISGLKNLTPTTVLVGIHVRRTDYCSWLKAYGGRLVNTRYLEEATRYFRTKFERVIFVVISDDKKWCRKHLGNWTDVTVAPDFPRPAYDMAVLSLCNHTIITYGTFGFWCAYLAGGETIYFAEYLRPESPFLKTLPYNKTYLPRWIGISALEPDFWEKYDPRNSCK